MKTNNGINFLFLILFATIVIPSVFLFADEFEEDDFANDVDSHAIKRKLIDITGSIKFMLHDKNNKPIQQLKNQQLVKSGNKFSINIKHNYKLFLYVFNIDATNTLYSLFPHDEALIGNPIQKGKSISLPGSSSEEDSLYEFDDNIGQETYYIFVATAAIKTLEEIQANIPSDGQGLSQNSSTMKTLKKLYKKGQKNIKTQRSNKIKFRGFYSKKLVLKHQ